MVVRGRNSRQRNTYIHQYHCNTCHPYAHHTFVVSNNAHVIMYLVHYLPWLPFPTTSSRFFNKQKFAPLKNIKLLYRGKNAANLKGYNNINTRSWSCIHFLERHKKNTDIYSYVFVLKLAFGDWIYFIERVFPQTNTGTRIYVKVNQGHVDTENSYLHML